MDGGQRPRIVRAAQGRLTVGTGYTPAQRRHGRRVVLAGIAYAAVLIPSVYLVARLQVGQPWQTLLAATRHGAEVCGVGAELGTVEVGKLADLIVVEANPLADIANVRRLQLVLKEGRVVSDKRHMSGAVPR